MVATGIGSTAIGEDGLAAPEERHDEMDAIMASAVDGPPGDLGDEEDERPSTLRVEDQPVTAEEGAPAVRDLTAPFEEEERQEAAAVEGEGDRYPRTVVMTSPKAARAKRGSGVTTRVMGEVDAAAPSTDDSGDKAEAPQPGADSPGGSSGEAESVTDDAGDGSEIFGPTRTKVMDLEAFGVPLDVDAYKDMFPEASQDQDDALLARVRAMDEVVIDVVPGGRVLDKRRTCQAARSSGKKIKIKVRVHYGLNQKQEIEKRYQLNEGGRQPTPKEKRRIQRERVWNLFGMRNILGLDISQQSIAKHTGYSLAWISKLEKEFLASNSSSSEKAVKRNLNRKMTPELVAKAKSLRDAGHSIDDIAKELGVHANTVRNSLKDPGTKAKAPMAAAEEPPARKNSATGTSRVTKPNPTSAQGFAAPHDLDFDTNELVDEALERCGIEQGKKSEWQSAGRQLLAERLKNCSDDHRDILKSAAQASVEFQAAADAATQHLQHLLAAGKEGVA